jgi:hypothetical protein
MGEKCSALITSSATSPEADNHVIAQMLDRGETHQARWLAQHPDPRDRVGARREEVRKIEEGNAVA